MITSLFSQNSYALPPAYNQGINAQQMDALKGVLSNYDDRNISESDAKHIVSEVKNLGITPGRTLAIVFAGEGFNAASIGDAAGVGKKVGAAEGGRPPPPGQAQGGSKGEVNTEALAALTLLVDANKGEAISDDQWTSFYQELESKGVETSKPIIDLKL